MVKVSVRVSSDIMVAHLSADQNVLSTQIVIEIKPVVIRNAKTRVQALVESMPGVKLSTITQFVAVHPVIAEILSLFANTNVSPLDLKI